MRRKPSLILLVLLRLSQGQLLLAQPVIKNPSTPQSGERAGRQLQLVELLSITDEGQRQFFFSFPGRVAVAPDGSIFKTDEGALFKFSPEGRFLGSLLSQGQGPGEISKYIHLHLQGNKIWVLDYRQRKLLIIDLEGTLLKEIKSLPSITFFCGLKDNQPLFALEEWPPLEERKSRLHKIIRKICLFSLETKNLREIFSFTYKLFLIAGGGAMSWDPTTLELSPDGRLLFINSTQEYRISVVNLDRRQVKLIFNRPYQRVKYKLSPLEKEFIKKHKAPQRKYKDDIQTIMALPDKLWVKTSTVDKNKGCLYDVFDFEGHYLDCFYLPSGIHPEWLEKDILYATKTDPSGSIYIVKYKILNLN